MELSSLATHSLENMKKSPVAMVLRAVGCAVMIVASYVGSFVWFHSNTFTVGRTPSLNGGHTTMFYYLEDSRINHILVNFYLPLRAYTGVIAPVVYYTNSFGPL